MNNRKKITVPLVRERFGGLPLMVCHVIGTRKYSTKTVTSKKPLTFVVDTGNMRSHCLTLKQLQGIGLSHLLQRNNQISKDNIIGIIILDLKLPCGNVLNNELFEVVNDDNQYSLLGHDLGKRNACLTLSQLGYKLTLSLSQTQITIDRFKKKSYQMCLVGGHDTDVLCDTGSHLSYIQRDFAELIGFPILPLAHPLKVYSAMDGKVSFRFMVVPQIILLKGVTYKTPKLVVYENNFSKSRWNILLGIDFLEPHQAVFTFGNNSKVLLP